MEQKQFYKRHIYIIDRKFQFKYLFIILSMIFVSVAAVSFVTFYVIWDNVIKEFFFIPEASVKLGDIFVRTSVISAATGVILLAVFGIAGIFISHKIAGPIYRVERVADELKKGNLDVKVRFRKDDDLQELADSLNKMIDGIKGMVSEDKEIIRRLTAMSEKLSEDVKKQKGLKKGVLNTIKKLNSIIAKLKKATDKFRT